MSYGNVLRMFTAMAVTAFLAGPIWADTHEGKVVEAGKGKLIMTDVEGNNQHTHTLSSGVKVMMNGTSASVDDLKKGAHVEVTVEKQNGKTVATAVKVLPATGRAQTTFDKPAVGHGASRASKVIGATVKNPAGENLGKIEDIVMNPHSGSVKYAVLSFGGFLGVGDKWFAIPWRALTITYDTDNRDKFHFVLNVDKERLKNAPGFDKNNWPDMANPKWGSEIDIYYGDKNK